MLSPNSKELPVILSGFATNRSRFSSPTRTPCLLAVDDSRTHLGWLTAVMEKWGCESLFAQSGSEALTLLSKPDSKIDLVILDREMPGINGIELLKRMRSDPSMNGIPVIMLTGSSEPTHMQQEINAGVFYHLNKPADPDLLRTVVMAGLRERKQTRLMIDEISRHDAALKKMNSCSLSVRDLREAEDAACLLASCHPDPVKAVTGFLELIINAVEHGNLELSYEDKTHHLAHGTWQQEIEHRLMRSPYKDRTVQIAYQRKEDSWVAQITDSGHGFDWRKYWHVDPAHATSSHGRGIPRARLMAFDKIAYNDKGNQVTVVTHNRPNTEFRW